MEPTTLLFTVTDALLTLCITDFIPKTMWIIMWINNLKLLNNLIF